MSSPLLNVEEIAQHIVHDPIQLLRLLADPIGFYPLIKVILPNEQLAFHPVMRQRMRPINETCTKPAYRTGGIHCNRLQIEIVRFDQTPFPSGVGSVGLFIQLQDVMLRPLSRMRVHVFSGSSSVLGTRLISLQPTRPAG